MKYWDSSALVALLVKASSSAERQALLREDPTVVTWWGSRIECASALNRLCRDGQIDDAGLDLSLQQLSRFAAGWLEVEPLQRVRERAIRLLRMHPLRGADALQLAAALTAAEEDPPRLDMVSSDERLSQAARREGFQVQ